MDANASPENPVRHHPIRHGTINHGGDLRDAMRRYGGERAAWLDLSTGINPWSWPSPRDFPRELSPEMWRALPARDDEAALIAAARDAYGVPQGVAVVAAPGVQAIIQWLPRLAPLAQGDTVAVVGPTYEEHAACWSRAAQVAHIDDIAALPPHARHAVIVNPNNPDGRIAPHARLAAAAGTIAARGGWLVVDESFADVVRPANRLAAATDSAPFASAAALCAAHPVIVLRSFGKFHGLAGLRLGFALARPAIAAPIAQALGPWAVSGPALVLGAAALADRAWAADMRVRLAAQARDLDALLARAGLAVTGGTDLFRLVRDPRARAIHEHLAARHIWSRVFDHDAALLRLGLPGDRFDDLAAALAGATAAL